uniref:Uncharacterized protein n=1 Tax=Romanomermis culicivorax TaxID=13658 RepID=A0A915IQE5_ROMCU
MKRNLKRKSIFSSANSASSSDKKTGTKSVISEFLFGRSTITTSNISKAKEPDEKSKNSKSASSDGTTVVTGIQFGKVVIGSVVIQETVGEQKMTPSSPSLLTSEISYGPRPVISGIQFNKLVISAITPLVTEKFSADDSSTSASCSSTYSSENARLLSRKRPFSAFVQLKAVSGGKSISGNTDFNKLLDNLGRSTPGQKFVSLPKNVCPICGFVSTLMEKD